MYPQFQEHRGCVTRFVGHYTNISIHASVCSYHADLSHVLAGIPTKKTRFDDAGAFYTDDEYEDNCQRISVAVDTVLSMAAGPEYTEVVLPEGGFGTGLAQLEAKAERTFAFLQTQVERIKAAFPLASAEAVGISTVPVEESALRPRPRLALRAATTPTASKRAYLKSVEKGELTRYCATRQRGAQRAVLPRVHRCARACASVSDGPRVARHRSVGWQCSGRRRARR